tara:strand:+ start:76 stop:336 length:261 start_codon:yes stop_codon:yes gene_type:complete
VNERKSLDELKEEKLIEEGIANYYNDIKEAINDFSEVIKLNPKNIEAFILRGFAKYLSKDLKGAINDFFEAVRLDPTSIDEIKIVF